MMNKSFISYLGSIILLCMLSITSCASQQPVQGEQPFSGAAQGSEEESDNPERNSLTVLFLGDAGHHQPPERVRLILPWFASQGIHLHYTDHQEDLTLENLKRFDVFMLYGNRSGLTREQETALLTYVQEGGGFVAIHSASASFNDSDAFVNLVGGAFKAHGVGTFRTEYVAPDHPVLQGVPNFESWDETYVHMKLNPDNEILEVRTEGSHREPWTWVRHQGDGRVFYTAWGHDERTWGHEGFQKLLERGVRWAAGDWALDTEFYVPSFTYGEGELPYYPAGEPWGTTGDPITTIQNPLSPEESLQSIVADPAFRIELFASEPDIINPIDFAWDEAGRLWALETVDYPNKFADNREGNDRIKVLEDTTGDGKADKVTIFAEGLNIPTSLVLYNGGVIVAQAPDFFFLKDTTGDGKADHKEVLFSGWGTFDTHAGPNNLRYGFDNQIWGAVGYSAFEGTVGDEEHRFSSGFYRFQPDGSSLEYISNTTNNTWGLGFNEEGIVFGSTANRDVPVHSVIPNRFYSNLRGGPAREAGPRLPMLANTNFIYPITDAVRQVDQHGRYTAGAGLEFYTARNFPESYWNRIAFISEPTGHLLGQFIFEPDGSTYSARNGWNMLASRDEWFSPIQAKVGPDGALWVIDWYNLVIQHNPFPEGWERGEGNAYITELRDQQHSRIYRVIYEGGEDAYQKFNLEDASPAELTAALKHDNLFWRLTAQRLLVERGEPDVLPQLVELLRDKTVDPHGLNPGALHALWTIHGLGVLDGSNRDALDAALGALHHPASSVRRAALMTIPRNEETLEKVLAANFLPDSEVPGDMNYTMPTSTMMAADPQVRLAALLAIAEMPASDRAGRAAADALVAPQNANDRWLVDAVAVAGAANEKSFLEHVMQQRVPENADSTYKANVSSAVERVATHYAMGDPSGTIAGLLLSLEEADLTLGIAFLTGVSEAWPEEQQPSVSDDQRGLLNQLRASLPEEYDEYLDQLAEKWESVDFFGSR